MEADWDQIICEVNSQYQNIKIVNSPTSGHVLLLDDDVMIAGKLTRGKHICGSDFWRQDVEQVSNLSHRFPSRGNTSSEECSHFRKRLDLHDGFVRRWNESRYSSGRFSWQRSPHSRRWRWRNPVRAAEGETKVRHYGRGWFISLSFTSLIQTLVSKI